MAEPAAAERLQPSLLDRLIDDEPDQRSEPREARVLTKQALRTAVLRDLAWLFNASNLEDRIDAARYPEVRKSVLNYGLPQLSGGYASSVDPGRLESIVRDAVMLFEPRIIASSLVIEAVLDRSILDLHNQIGLVIRGLLWAQPVPLEFVLRTQLDLEDGAIVVVDAGRPNA
ncbi:type VI secretion system baseplate subunit TssE [Pigmentiphaga soli]|uniref:Type VI secretion system baseplate subunit TssE n=1 Tax=Pigmentiphaga soli TaxID=1007095 RepID=A0ABP8HP16_9BURK